MFGKILLTVAVILGAYSVIRARMRDDREAAATPPVRPATPLVPSGILKAVAMGLVVAMVAGSLLWLYLNYTAGREIVCLLYTSPSPRD